MRIFCIKEKVNLLTITGANTPQRQETNAAKARIRYVAGYCLSSLRKKFVNMRSGNIYSKTSEGQASYDYTRCALKLITALREDEHFLKINTSDPDSFADIERRQYSSGRLINVSDYFYKIMQKLTTSILSILIYDNLMKHGKDLMSHCLCKIMEQQEFYQKFVTGSVTSFRVSQVEEFSECESIKNLIDHMSLVSSIIADIYKLIVKKYIMVLLAQFRRDFKSYLNVEKTIAHRKQIKTTKKSTAKERTESSTTEMKQKRKKKKAESELTIQETSTDEIEHKGRRRKTKPAFLDSSSDAETHEIEPKRRKKKTKPACLDSSSEAETGPSSEPQPSPSSEPEPGPSSEPQPGPSSEPQPDLSSAPDEEQGSDNADEDLCHKCFSDKEGDWIQCDSCDHWFHRKCAGIKTLREYKKVSATGSSWFCKDCK